jgi:hypothetical protein
VTIIVEETNNVVAVEETLFGVAVQPNNTVVVVEPYGAPEIALPWYIVTEYGVEPENLGSQNAEALTDLITQVTDAGGGVLYWPTGLFQITNVVSPVSQVPIDMWGSGEGLTIIQGASPGIALNFQQPNLSDGITFDCNLTASCMLQQSTSLLNAKKYSTVGTVSNGITTTIAAGSNGVAVNTLNGTVSIYCEAIPENAPAAGTVLGDAVEGDLGCTATITYDGVDRETNQLLNCALVCTVGNGLLLTGAQIQWPISGAVSQYVATTGTVSYNNVSDTWQVVVADAAGIAWGMNYSDANNPLASGLNVGGISGTTITLVGTAVAGSGPVAFSPTNMVQIGADIRSELGDLAAIMGTPNIIGTIGGVGADTVVGIDVFGSALSGYWQTTNYEFDGTSTWVYMVTSETGSAPLYPDRTVGGKTATVGTGFNYIAAHTMGKCTFINQPSASATAGAFNIVDYAAINIHSLLCQGGERPAGYDGNRFQIELFKADVMTSGPGNISQECESLNFLNVTTVLIGRASMNYTTGGAAFGQAGNFSLRVGPNFFGCDNVQVGEIVYDIGKPTSVGVTVGSVQLTYNSPYAVVGSGGFPNVIVGDVVINPHVPSGTTVSLINGDTLTLSAPASSSAPSTTLAFEGGGQFNSAYKDSLVNTHSGGSLGRLAVGVLRVVDPYYVAGPLFLQGTKVQVGVMDIQPGSSAFIQTATAGDQTFKIANGVIGGGIQIQNAAGLLLELGQCRVFPAWSHGTQGTGCVEFVSGSAPPGSAAMGLFCSNVVWDFNYLPTVTNPIIGVTYLTIDAHVHGGAVANVPGSPGVIPLLSVGTYTSSSRVNSVSGTTGYIDVGNPTASPFTYPALGVDGFYTVTANASGVTSFYTGTVGSANATTIPAGQLVTGIFCGAGDTLTVDYADAPVVSAVRV